MKPHWFTFPWGFNKFLGDLHDNDKTTENIKTITFQLEKI